MKFLAKSRIGTLLFALAASSALFAQSRGMGDDPNHANVLDADQIVGQAVAATERSWDARNYYVYTKRDEDRRLDSLGQVKSESVDVTRMGIVNGVRFEQLIEHNGQPPSTAERRKNQEDLDKLKHETLENQAVRLRSDQENRSLLHDVLEAFDFHLIGEETVEGRRAYVVQATPHPGYVTHSKYGKLFSKLEGKLWIDMQDFGLIKVDGQVTQAFSMGLFIARVQRGSHVILEQTSSGDAIWVPKHLEIRASARILFVKSLDMDRTLTYSDYSPAENYRYSVIEDSSVPTK